MGAAGHKLDALLGCAGLTREEIYIANVVKCRPPGNRNPKPEEIEACAPFLREQIRSIWPDVIVCLGNFASQFVLRTSAGVTSLRGKLYQTGHFTVCPTFHPAACIYHSPTGSRCWRTTCEWWAPGSPSTLREARRRWPRRAFARARARRRLRWASVWATPLPPGTCWF